MLIFPKERLKLRATSMTILPAVFRASEDAVAERIRSLPWISTGTTGENPERELSPWRTKRALGED